MTSLDPHDRRPEEQHPNPQAEQHIDKLERKIEALADEVERLRWSLDWIRGRVKNAVRKWEESHRDEGVLEDLFDDVDEEVADAFDAAEDSQDE